MGVAEAANVPVRLREEWRCGSVRRAGCRRRWNGSTRTSTWLRPGRAPARWPSSSRSRATAARRLQRDERARAAALLRRAEQPPARRLRQLVRMCHEIPLEQRLTVDAATVPLAELLLTKLQIIELNEKDVRDTVALSHEHEVTGDDSDVNAARVAELCGADWGLWRTITADLETSARISTATRSRRAENELVSSASRRSRSGSRRRRSRAPGVSCEGRRAQEVVRDPRGGLSGMGGYRRCRRSAKSLPRSSSTSTTRVGPSDSSERVLNRFESWATVGRR